MPRPYQYGEKVDYKDEERDIRLCPEPGCGKEAVAYCRCLRAESICPDGHQWHVDDAESVQRGHGHH